MDVDAQRPQDVADRLLAHLRQEVDAGLGFAAPPATLTGGFETYLGRGSPGAMCRRPWFG